MNGSVEGDFISLVYSGDDVWRRLIVTALRQDTYCWMVEIVRQNQPAARPVPEHISGRACQVTGRFMVSDPALELPRHHEDFRVKAIQPDNSVHFRFGFQPADSTVQVTPYR